MISNWKREFFYCGAGSFSTKASDEEAARHEKALYGMIERLEFEVYFCRRPSEQLGELKKDRYYQ